jgi:uncharacterized protein DUF6164
MAKLFFSLRNVPADEAEDVRELLEQHQIDYYETSAGNWGISMPALWLNNEEDYPIATQLLDDYQEKRRLEQRALYQALKQAGKHRRINDVIREKPLLFLLSVGFSAFILYISIKFVFDLGF